MSQITMTDGRRVLTFGDGENVRRRILEQQGWKVVDDGADAVDKSVVVVDAVDAVKVGRSSGAKERSRATKKG